MSNFMVALLVGLGSGAWVYAKMMKKSGGITSNALIVSGVGALLVFIITLIIAGMFV